MQTPRKRARTPYTVPQDVISAFRGHDRDVDNVTNVKIRKSMLSGVGIEQRPLATEVVGKDEMDGYIENKILLNSVHMKCEESLTFLKYREYALLEEADSEKMTMYTVWMCALSIHYKLEHLTLDLAYAYFRRCISESVNVRVKNGWVLSAVCLVLACKVNEVEVDKCIGMSDLLKKSTKLENVDIVELAYVEAIILDTLKWKISYIITPDIVMDIMQKSLTLSDTEVIFAKKNIQLLYKKYSVLHYRAFIICVACLCHNSNLHFKGNACLREVIEQNSYTQQYLSIEEKLDLVHKIVAD